MIESRGFLATSPCLSKVRQLFDVVDEREQLPLSIDLGSATQRETIQSLVVAYIAEHRLDGGEAATVLVSAFFTIDACTHRLRTRGNFFAREHRDLSYFAGVRFTQAFAAQRAVFAG